MLNIISYFVFSKKMWRIENPTKTMNISTSTLYMTSKNGKEIITPLCCSFDDLFLSKSVEHFCMVLHFLQLHKTKYRRERKTEAARTIIIFSLGNSFHFARYKVGIFARFSILCNIVEHLKF